MLEINAQDMAKAAYKGYCKQAGGVTFDGKPLPNYEALGADRQACWQAAAKEVMALTLAFKAISGSAEQLAQEAQTHAHSVASDGVRHAS